MRTTPADVSAEQALRSPVVDAQVMVTAAGGACVVCGGCALCATLERGNSNSRAAAIPDVARRRTRARGAPATETRGMRMRISTGDAGHGRPTPDPPHVIACKRFAPCRRVRWNTVLASVMPEELRMNGTLGVRP